MSTPTCRICGFELRAHEDWTQRFCDYCIANLEGTMYGSGQ